jgi:hypothetical protein
MKKLFGVPFQDLHNVSEDDCISAIAECAHRGEKVAVLVDDEPEKVARYKAKLASRGCAIEFEGQGPVANVVTLTVTGKRN